MIAKRVNIRNFKKGRILRLEELKLSILNGTPVWVYLKDYANSKAKLDQADIGVMSGNSLKFATATFAFDSLKDKDNCSIVLNKKTVMKIYKALPNRTERRKT